jgi:ABC-2 type transport system ATP-binding protein
MPLIEAKGLTKKFRQAVKEPGLVGSLRHLFTRQYRDKMAVDHIDLSVEAGESVAYLGPNGAGKSTTIKMLTGILVPTEGRLIVDGLVPHERRQQNARKMGVVFGQRHSCGGTSPSSSRSTSPATCTRSRPSGTRRTSANSPSCSGSRIS